jgi:threonine dehydrogenase-like Zn-dependent dehydrogenase
LLRREAIASAVQNELRVAGSHDMSAVDYPAMLAMITDGRLDLAELIAERIPLEKAGAAMMAMDNPVARGLGSPSRSPTPAVDHPATAR